MFKIDIQDRNNIDSSLHSRDIALRGYVTCVTYVIIHVELLFEIIADLIFAVFYVQMFSCSFFAI